MTNILKTIHGSGGSVLANQLPDSIKFASLVRSKICIFLWNL